MVRSSQLERVLAAIPGNVLSLCRRLREHGKRAWVVGGCVRDVLRGAEAKDWDVATDALPEEVTKMFRRVIPTGIAHGTVTVVLGHKPYEVTTLRGESDYRDGRRPAEVVFLSDITQDLARRDFTFNAIAVDPISEQLIDPFGGAKDLDHRLVRAVGVAEERFAEDGLRVLRAARFAATLECSIDPATLAAMGSRRALDTFAKVSAERIHDEWLKTMSARRPSVAFDVMLDTGIVHVISPALAALRGCPEERSHGPDAWLRGLATVDACPADPVLRMAALLYGIGTPLTAVAWSFPLHAERGAQLADELLRALRFSNEDRQRIVHLVRHQALDDEAHSSDAGARRWVRRITRERLDDTLALTRARVRATEAEPQRALDKLDALEQRAHRVISEGMVHGAGDLAIRGGELIGELGKKPGPWIGELLQQLVELCTDDPALNERAALIAQARLLAKGESTAG
jgi:tRNA nucleotidyltransferase (CCA-adding enzyme)